MSRPKPRADARLRLAADDPRLPKQLRNLPTKRLGTNCRKNVR